MSVRGFGIKVRRHTPCTRRKESVVHTGLPGPCKHLAAVINVIAAEIDRNPFLIFRLHGYDIIGELSKKELEAVTDSVSIPAPTDLAAAGPAEADPAVVDPAVAEPAVANKAVADPAMADPGESCASRGTMSLDEIDFSVLEG